MRKLGINGILTLAVATSVSAGICILILFVTASTTTLSTALQEESLRQMAQTGTKILNIYIDGAKGTAASLASQPAVLAAMTSLRS